MFIRSFLAVLAVALLSRSAQAQGGAPLATQPEATATSSQITPARSALAEEASGTPPSAAAGAQANEPQPPSAAAFLRLRPAPPDIAAFPARLSDQSTAAAELGVEVHGVVVAWVTPWSEASPASARDTYRLRFGVLRIDARPLKNVSVLARLGLMLPSSPLLDFAVTYTPHTAWGVTVGQFRLPIGAAATTLAPQLVLLDRPTYVYAMTKLAFRDVGVMFHSSPRGLGDGVFHYRLVAASGAGRAGVGQSRAPSDLTESLLGARAIVELGRFLSKRLGDRLAFGASYVRSTDPAIDTGDAARDRELAVNVLGRTLAPIGVERVTQLAGADLTFVYGALYSQAELLYLHSKARAADARREGLGASLDLGYTLPLHPWDALDLQLAGRVEHFDPRADLPDDDVQLATLGVNAIAGAVRASVFATLTFFESSGSGKSARAGEITLRMAAAF